MVEKGLPPDLQNPYSGCFLPKGLQLQYYPSDCALVASSSMLNSFYTTIIGYVSSLLWGQRIVNQTMSWRVPRAIWHAAVNFSIFVSTPNTCAHGEIYCYTGSASSRPSRSRSRRSTGEWRARATCKETQQATCSADNHACAVQLPTPSTVFCICSILKSSNKWTRRARLKSLCYADPHHSFLSFCVRTVA